MTIYSYGVCLAVAVLVCSFLLRREAQAHGFHPDQIMDLVFWSVLSGIIGCRIFYVLLNLSFFLEHPSEIIMLQRGGLAWQGGLIAGTLTAIFFIKKNGLDLWAIADLTAPYIALGQAIGRIGCLLNGCCYGRQWEHGIFFPTFEARLHPTQIYDSLGLLLIFLILRQLQERRLAPGRVFVLYFILSAALRFAVEFFRADHATLVLGLSIFQIVSLSIMSVAVYVYLYLKSR